MALGNINVPDNNKLGKLETAASASRLSNTENIGSATRPVYFNSSGVPVAGTYELHKTVPTDALFTDTTYSVATTETAGLMSASDKVQVDKIGDYITSFKILGYDAKHTLFLLTDVTDWYTGTAWKKCVRIQGNIMGYRTGIASYSEQSFANITISLHYARNGKNTYQLATSNSRIIPCIVSTTDDNGDTIYWLAIIERYSSGNEYIFTGCCYSPYGNTISFSNKIGYSTSLDLPDGYNIVIGCEPFTQNNFALGTRSEYYDYDKIKALEDRISALENK